MAVKDLFESKREETVNRWIKQDRDKEEKILKVEPLENIKCPKCKTVMNYLWSDLYDRGSSDEPDEQVMFFYDCPKDGERKIFFENGDPWIVEAKKAA
jgi:DNA-directed RNA polymerase subunit M/transcription elongation factor TFIIS